MPGSDLQVCMWDIKPTNLKRALILVVRISSCYNMHHSDGGFSRSHKGDGQYWQRCYNIRVACHYWSSAISGRFVGFWSSSFCKPLSHPHECWNGGLFTPWPNWLRSNGQHSFKIERHFANNNYCPYNYSSAARVISSLFIVRVDPPRICDNTQWDNTQWARCILIKYCSSHDEKSQAVVSISRSKLSTSPLPFPDLPPSFQYLTRAACQVRQIPRPKLSQHLR